MDFEFYKLHSAGNDFILANLIHHEEIAVNHFTNIAKAACKRHSGIGANGIIFLTPGEKAQVKVHCFDREHRPVVCFDALACVGRYMFDSGLADRSIIVVETLNGDVKIDVIDSRNFRLKVGTPRRSDSGDTIVADPDTDLFSPVTCNGRSLPAAQIKLARNMAVVITEERRQSLRQLAKDLAALRPRRSPVFIRTISRDRCEMYVWQYPEAPDFATSAGGAAVAAASSGFCDMEITFYLRQHPFYAQWDTKENSVYVTAPAEYLFSGSYYFDEEAGSDTPSEVGG